ncbi:MAG: GntR family transcriptional regulator [Sciscionella sp.]
MPDELTSLSKSQRAYQVIKSRITDGSYGPGYRLVLGTLAKELCVSAVPVREAVRMLEAEGFVEFERNVGAQVTAINPTEYLHTMQTLAVVEGAATGLAAPHVTEETIDTATAINERLRASLRDFDPRTFTRLNHEFHECLYQHCPNPHLVDLVHRGWHRLAAIRESTFSFVPGRAESSVAEHDELLALLRDGADADAVERHARAHRTATLTAYLSRDRSGEHTNREDQR